MWIALAAALFTILAMSYCGNKIKKEGTPMAQLKDVEIFATKIEEVQQAELGEAHDGIPISYYVVRAIMDIAKRKGIETELREQLKKGGIQV